MNKKTDRIIKIILVIVAIITVIGISYALLTTSLTGEKNYVLSSTGLRVYLDETKNISDIIGLNEVPVPDKLGIKKESYIFSIHNETNKAIDYNIYLVEDNESTMPIYGVKYNLYNSRLKVNKINYVNENIDSVGNLLYTGFLSANSEEEFELKLWLGERAENDCKNKTFSARISVEAVQNITNKYAKNELNGNDPILKEGLIPVTIIDGVAYKADVNYNWYDYENNIWANAVILNDEEKEFNIGDKITEEDIESYFVWIPKFDYQIFNMGNYTALGTLTDATQEINVRFSNENTENNDTECAYPLDETKQQAIAGEGFDVCSVGKWMTHPAFTTMDVKGFWVGKFETGYLGATTTATAQVNSVDTSKIIIKPNVYSWRSITVGNMFKNSYDYKRELDSHMMKNTEWGAMTYLSASKYGYKDKINQDNKRTTPIINNNSGYVTGYSSTEEPTKGYVGTSGAGNRFEAPVLKVDSTYTRNYLNSYSQLASTTANYSGVYDTSGGSWDYVMGYTTAVATGGSSGILTLYPDFFNDRNYYKYWDKYTTSSNVGFNNRILGDATGELGPFKNVTYPDSTTWTISSWNADNSQMVNSDNPWFRRGSRMQFGTGAGIYNYYKHTGALENSFTYRIVLSPKEV